MQTATKLRGFTLIELMMTIVVLAIFAALAVPSFTTFIANNRIKSNSNELANLLQYARSAAVGKNSSFIVCEDAGTWTVRPKGTSASPCGQSELRSFSPSTEITIASSENALPLTFNANGSTGTPNKSFTICKGTDTSTGFKITVQASGKVRLWSKGKDENGNALSSCSL